MTATKPTTRLNSQEAIFCLNALFTGWQFMELMDEIQETTLYRHSLKQKVKLLMPELEKFVDAIGVFFSVDVQAMNNLFSHKKELAHKLVSMRPELQSGLNELLAMYFESPEKVLEMLDIKLL